MASHPDDLEGDEMGSVGSGGCSDPFGIEAANSPIPHEEVCNLLTWDDIP